MAFVAAAKTYEIAPGSMAKVVVEGQEVLLANVGGSFHATAERCPHLGGHLSTGELQDGIVTCPRHGAGFDVRTGLAVRGAKILFLHMDVKALRTYPVRVEGDDLLVDLEERA
ncbi:MAG TPA: Rieske 2Fe-2S domain-containing protein [Anaerolineae bacterium]|nr:Rieske 2Fe-2S domain-containing protein [Anaerolineae bacterium]